MGNMPGVLRHGNWVIALTASLAWACSSTSVVRGTPDTGAGAGGGGAAGSAGAAGAAGTAGGAGMGGTGGSAGTGGTGGGAGTGGTGTGGAGGSGGAGGASSCARPVLLVGEEDLSNTNKPGRLLRFSLAGSPTRCPDLQGGGTLPSQPFSVAWIPPDLVAVASWGEVVVVDPATDLEQWSANYGSGSQDYPIDVFPLQDASSNPPLVAVAAGSPGAEIRSIVTFSHAGAAGPVYTLNSTSFPLGLGWVGMTADPLAPGHFLALNTSQGIAMREVDPFAPSVVGTDLTTTHSLSTIYALDAGGLRIAWVGNAAGTSDAVFYRTTANTISPPIGCRDRTCEYEHVVPDPTDATRYIALCGDASNVIRQVVRFSSTDPAGKACDVLLDGATLGSTKRLSRLAVIP